MIDDTAVIQACVVVGSSIQGREPLRGASTAVSGWRIRWSSAGRAAAIGAAVLAAIAVLPSLISGDQPPPLPDDVGLAPAVESEAALAPQPLSPPPPAAIPAPKKRSKPAKPRKPHRQRSRGHRERPDRADVAEAATPAPSVSDPPALRYDAPDPSSEFGFER